MAARQVKIPPFCGWLEFQFRDWLNQPGGINTNTPKCQRTHRHKCIHSQKFKVILWVFTPVFPQVEVKEVILSHDTVRFSRRLSVTRPWTVLMKSTICHGCLHTRCRRHTFWHQGLTQTVLMYLQCKAVCWTEVNRWVLGKSKKYQERWRFEWRIAHTTVTQVCILFASQVILNMSLMFSSPIISQT